MNKSNCGHAFHSDGSLRDIYVQNVTVKEWEAFLNFLGTGNYRLQYFRDGDSAQLPANAAKVLSDRSCSHNLVIDITEVKICCHFFMEDEIELDVDPREINSEASESNVLDFMVELGAYLNRDVILTEENSPSQVWFRYSSKDGAIKCEHTA